MIVAVMEHRKKMHERISRTTTLVSGHHMTLTQELNIQEYQKQGAHKAQISFPENHYGDYLAKKHRALRGFIQDMARLLCLGIS